MSLITTYTIASLIGTTMMVTTILLLMRKCIRLEKELKKERGY